MSLAIFAELSFCESSLLTWAEVRHGTLTRGRLPDFLPGSVGIIPRAGISVVVAMRETSSFTPAPDLWQMRQQLLLKVARRSAACPGVGSSWIGPPEASTCLTSALRVPVSGMLAAAAESRHFRSVVLQFPQCVRTEEGGDRPGAQQGSEPSLDERKISSGP